jgi:hypothetical protein
VACVDERARVRLRGVRAAQDAATKSRRSAA